MKRSTPKVAKASTSAMVPALRNTYCDPDFTATPTIVEEGKE